MIKSKWRCLLFTSLKVGSNSKLFYRKRLPCKTGTDALPTPRLHYLTAPTFHQLSPIKNFFKHPLAGAVIRWCSKSLKRLREELIGLAKKSRNNEAYIFVSYKFLLCEFSTLPMTLKTWEHWLWPWNWSCVTEKGCSKHSNLKRLINASVGFEPGPLFQRIHHKSSFKQGTIQINRL